MISLLSCVQRRNLNITLPASMGINLKRKDKFINCYKSRVRLWLALASLSRKRSYRGWRIDRSISSRCVSSELSSHSRASSRQDRGEEKWMRDRTTYGDRVSIRESNQRAPIPFLVPWTIRLESSRISYLVLARGHRELRRVRLCTKRIVRCDHDPGAWMPSFVRFDELSKRFVDR